MALRRLAALGLLALLAACARPGVPPAGPPPAALPDLRLPAGRADVRALARLASDPEGCRARLAAAGARVVRVPPHGEGACGHAQAVAFADGRLGGARLVGRADLPLSCPLAAALLLWERDVVQPAALRHLGSRVVAVEHWGSYACRPIRGSAGGRLSEHAQANAIDIAAFRLADGQRITLLADWEGAPARRLFLRALRDGACRLFATVLSPDFDAAHRDHFHFDQAARHVGRPFCR